MCGESATVCTVALTLLPQGKQRPPSSVCPDLLRAIKVGKDSFDGHGCRFAARGVAGGIGVVQQLPNTMSPLPAKAKYRHQ